MKIKRFGLLTALYFVSEALAILTFSDHLKFFSCKLSLQSIDSKLLYAYENRVCVSSPEILSWANVTRLGVADVSATLC